MKSHRTFYFIFTGIFLLVAAVFFYAGYNTDPAAIWDKKDSFNLKKFLYIMAGCFFVFPMLLIGPLLFFRWRAKNRRSFLLEHGQKGNATVLSVARTGVEIDRIPRLSFRLRITTEAGETYEVHHKQLYDVVTLGPVPVGNKRVPVFIDKKNRNNILVVWE